MGQPFQKIFVCGFTLLLVLTQNLSLGFCPCDRILFLGECPCSTSSSCCCESSDRCCDEEPVHPGNGCCRFVFFESEDFLWENMPSKGKPVQLEIPDQLFVPLSNDDSEPLSASAFRGTGSDGFPNAPPGALVSGVLLLRRHCVALI